MERYGWAACAAGALAFAAVAGPVPHRVWGVCAAVGYGLAALCASRAVAVLGAVAVPLAVLVVGGLGQSEVGVVERSGALLLATGSPYAADPATVADYNPYLPGMALFGLLPGDARWWMGLVFAGTLVAAVALLGSPERGGFASAQGAAARSSAALLVGCPLVALPLAVGGVDLPVVGLLCLGLALAGQGRSDWAGVAVGMACALKWTAWPALPVLLALIVVRQGRREAIRYAGVAVAVAGAAVAPVALADPAGFSAHVIAFPLGLTTAVSPAASPLPGHLLAAHVPGGSVAAVALLAVAALLVSVSLAVRPPHSVRAAADRLALGLGLAMALMPATRFGYLVYPLALWALPRCLPARESADRLASPVRREVA